MDNALSFGWITCFIAAYLLQLVSININDNSNFNRVKIYLQLIAWILSVTGFILFIVWLTRFDNTKVLKTMWIVSLITFILLMGIVIFTAGTVSNKVVSIPGYLVGYSFTIFIGTLIAFLVKNK